MDIKSNKKSIRVCFVAPKAYPLFVSGAAGVIGGAELDLYYLATELAQDEGFAVSMVTADYGQEEVEIHEGIRVIKSLDFGKNALAGGWRIWQALGRADAQIYLIKTFSPGTPLVRWFCRRRGRAFIYRTAHRYDCDGTYIRRQPLLGRAFAWSLRGAEMVLSQNDNDALLLKNTIGVSAKVIPNGHRLYPLYKSDGNVILWSGRSTILKRPELFIELARQMPGENFCMICQEATEDKKYSQLVEKTKAVKNLQFIPHVPFPKIENYFQQARLLVNTSDAEGFPNTFIQACKRSVPILSLHVNPDNFLDRYECGICADGDWDLFVRGFKTLLEPETALRYGSNGRRYAEKKHDITKIIEEYKDIFKGLASKNLD